MVVDTDNNLLDKGFYGSFSWRYEWWNGAELFDGRQAPIQGFNNSYDCLQLIKVEFKKASSRSDYGDGGKMGWKNPSLT